MHRGPLLAMALVLSACSDTVAPPVPASISVTPGAVELAVPGATFQLQAVVRAADGTPVPDAVVEWTTGDPDVVVISSRGLATAVADGETSVPARAAGLALRPAGPDSLAAAVTSTLSLTARVENMEGDPYPGATVRWTVAPGSGLIAAGAGSSGTDGTVDATWTLGTLAGPQTAFATLETGGELLVVAFNATATPGPATSVALSADTVFLGGPGEQAWLRPLVLDAWGNVAAAEDVTWSTHDPGVATVDELGVVTGTGAGSAWVVASLGARLDSVEVTLVPRGAVTLTFDDGWRSVYENAWPVLQDFPGLRANVGVYTEAVGWPGYLTEAHLAELHEAGWSMVSHTVSHDSLTTLSAPELDHELRASQEWLRARGFRGTDVLIAPYHDFTDAERAAAATYYRAARGTSAHATVPETLVPWMPEQPFHLTGIPADDLPYTTGEGRDRLRDLLARARDEGRFLDVFLHQVPPENVDAFRALLEVLAEFGGLVRPYHELFPVEPRTVY